jgi:hypothetical protein
MRRSRLASILVLLTLASWNGGAAATPIRVQSDGAVSHPGTLTLKQRARLSDAALAAQPRPDAYLLGAAWLRVNLQRPQLRLKAGVLFDLGQLQQRALQGDHTGLATLAVRLRRWLAAMPVTGRQPALLDPRAVEINAAANHRLVDGDRLVYPQRPGDIRVVGAVQHACRLPLVPLQDARRYLAGCPGDRMADPDTIYVIEPDGRVFVQGIALWNRSAPLVLAPGAVIYVPLRSSAIKPIDPSLNHDLATFLSTQLLPAPGVP